MADDILKDGFGKFEGIALIALATQCEGARHGQSAETDKAAEICNTRKHSSSFDVGSPVLIPAL